MVQVHPNNWYINQNLQNYLVSGADLPTNTCPADKPYLINDACANCEGENPLFDVNSKACVKCPENTYFSELTHTCKDVVEG